MIRTTRCLVLIMLIVATLAKSENIITFFIRPYHTPPAMSQTDFLDALQNTGRLAELILKRLVEVGHYQGVIASYMGYVTVSDFAGQITFPRLHQPPEVKLVITPMIEPIMMIGATVHHLELLNSLPAEMYTITRKQAPSTKIFYWDVQKTDVPNNKRISLDTIILFAKPDTIKVPLGITETDDSPMLMLPDLYATQELNVTVEALRSLKIRHFFGPVIFNFSKQSDVDYAQQLVP
ncbi:MAG: hypothetical protein AB7F19_06195 [Candidatus Babeliales bacterium]